MKTPSQSPVIISTINLASPVLHSQCKHQTHHLVFADELELGIRFQPLNFSLRALKREKSGIPQLHNCTHDLAMLPQKTEDMFRVNINTQDITLEYPVGTGRHIYIRQEISEVRHFLKTCKVKEGHGVNHWKHDELRAL